MLDQAGIHESSLHGDNARRPAGRNAARSEGLDPVRRPSIPASRIQDPAKLAGRGNGRNAPISRMVPRQLTQNFLALVSAGQLGSASQSTVGFFCGQGGSSAARGRSAESLPRYVAMLLAVGSALCKFQRLRMRRDETLLSCSH